MVVNGRIVHGAICRACPLRDSEPLDRFIAFPSTEEKLVDRCELELVVAHYEEDLAWLDDFSFLNRKVYSKGASGGEHPLPNIGREAHSYLYHIIENYDSLAEVTVFIQGHPHDHVSRLFEKITALDSATDFLYLGDDILVEDGRGVPPQPGLKLAEFYSKLFGNKPPEHYSCRAGACFAVSRTCIHSRPLSFYQKALDLVLSESQGPWAIERLWHLIFDAKADTEGILTASDSGFFRDLQFLIRSLASTSRYPICVIDLGLTEQQVDWCLERPGVMVWRMPQVFAPMRKVFEQHWWQAWIKPFYFLEAPFERVLWIDADCVVLKSVEGLMETLREQPVFIGDGTEVVTENDPRLYDHLKLPEGTRTHGISVNSGVVGLSKSRDSDILQAWAWAAQWIGMNPGKQDLSAWADQGLLLWAILKNQAAHLIQESLEANRPSYEIEDLLGTVFRSGRTVLEELKCRFPDDTIVHFLGSFKLSRQLDEQFGVVFGDD